MTKKQTKKAFKDYHSSDYGNEDEEEDYGQDFEDEEDDFDQMGGDEDQNRRGGRGRQKRAGPADSGNYDDNDSEYGDEGGKKSKSRRAGDAGGRNDDRLQNDEDTYEDEDPCQPDIDMILADKQVEQPASVQPAPIPPPQHQGPGRPSRAALQLLASQQQPKIQNMFLVKFSEQSYLHVKWMSEADLEDYSFKAKQKIRRYWGQKEKKRYLEQMSRQAIQFKKKESKPSAVANAKSKASGGGLHHHFSDDEEEEEQNEALADVAALEIPDVPPLEGEIAEGQLALVSSEPQRPQFLSVIGPDGEDLTQYFDKTYVGVERILSTTQLFPVIHPRQAKQVRGKWQEDCLKVISVLINFRKNNVSLGLAFAEQLDPDNEDLADYFKVIKQPMDFIMIMNRLYNKSYQHPMDFWSDLGLVFRNCRAYNKSTKFALRKQCDILRCLAFHLYNDWHSEQMQRFTTGIALPPALPQQQLQQQQQQPQPSPLPQQQPTLNQQQQQVPNMTTTMPPPPMQIPAMPTSDQQPKLSTRINLQSLLQRDKPAQPQQPVLNEQTSGSIQQQQDPQVWNQQMINQQQQQQMINQGSGSNQFQQPQALPKINQLMGGAQNQIVPVGPNGLGINMAGPDMIGLNQTAAFGAINPQTGMPISNQLDWMQGPNAQAMAMSMGLNSQQANNLLIQNQTMTQNIPGMDLNQSRQLQLPSINQLGQNLALQSQLGLQQNNPFLGLTGGPGSIQGFNGLPQINPMTGMPFNMTSNGLGGFNNNSSSAASIEMQIQMISQMNIPFEQKQQLANQIIAQSMNQGHMGPGGMGMNDPMQAMMMMGGQGGVQDFAAMNQMMNNMRGMNGGMLGQNQLPPISALQSMNMMSGASQNGLQLPPIASLGQNLLSGSNMSTMDPYSQMLQQQQQLQMLNQMGGQKMLPPIPGMNNSTMGMNSSNIDELSLMLSMQNAGMNPAMAASMFGQQNNPQLPLLDFSAHMQTASQLLGGNNGMMGPPLSQMDPRSQNRHGMQSGRIRDKSQTTTIMDPNMMNDCNENFLNDKNENPVPPCIMDPGQYDLSWLIENGETPDSLASCPYISKDEIDVAIKSKNSVDQLFLVKWRGLSYTQSTWEPESLVKPLFEEKIQDYNRFNRSLDQIQRDKLDHLIKNHKKMLRFTEKKYAGHGNRKIDPTQENILSLQEAKINRGILNQKIQELMGDLYYQVVQYSEANGAVPKFKKPHQKLKDYQVAGLNWLIRAWHEHRNVVLADEMGLGKTIMTLSLFDHLNKAYRLRGPFLILAPLTTLEHWKRIADEWTSMNSVLYYDPGSAEGRQEIRQWEWYYTDITYKGTITQKSELLKFNIMITSFEVFMSDLNPIIQEIPFIYIVVDEAHRLKNKQAKTLKLLKDHPCKRILLLTGTPVQNNTKELWTLLNYIEPEKFNNMDQFLEQYGNLESYDQIQKLHTMLKPHFLRRMKDEVENSIPPLNETVVEVGLTNLQNTYYKGIYGENRMVLAKFGTNSIKSSQLNNMDVQLRKCCNHLFLLKGVEEELTRDCKSEEDVYNKLLESSGKLMLLDKFIEKFKKENHKMLIFSQFKRMLDIIELYLKMKGVPYEKLTGSVKTQDRISAIQRFNDDKLPSGEGGGNGFGVFLLTTRAGGLGINLTTARVVIIFDSDWNPQNDLQAIARAHRIGQKFEVQVYRLITSKTYEEQMFERASKKLGMEQALFSKGAFNPGLEDPGALNLEGGLQLRSLQDLKQDSKEIENLLKYGAYAFMNDDKECDNEEEKALREKDIDEILATGKKKEFQYNKGVYSLQKSTFNASKYEKGALPDVNDPEFWNKVLPMQTLISITMLEKKFKKEKKDIGKNEKEQKEFIKDLEIVFNDFMDAKFDDRVSAASRKQFESDEETLRELLKKMVKLSGMKLMYVEKCKEWLREMLRTSKRKKPLQTIEQADRAAAGIIEDDFEGDAIEDDDIIMYDSDNENRRPLRKRNPPPQPLQQPEEEKKKPKEAEQAQEEIEENPELNIEDEFADDLQLGQRRSLRARKPASKAEYEEDVYGAEDVDGEYGEKGKGKRRSARQQNSMKIQQEKAAAAAMDEAGELSGEERYGLRGRRKRQKLDKEGAGENSSKNLMAQQSSASLVEKGDPLLPVRGAAMLQFINKRNEKNGIVCALCLQPETVENQCTWFCQGYCQRSFHEKCKEELFNAQTRLENPPSQLATRRASLAAAKGIWQCDDCLDNIAECYCCKKKGLILVFPKKGKPKAPGSSNQIEGGPATSGILTNAGDDEENRQANDEVKQENEDLAGESENAKAEAPANPDNDQVLAEYDAEVKPNSPVKETNLTKEVLKQQMDQDECVPDTLVEKDVAVLKEQAENDVKKDELDDKIEEAQQVEEQIHLPHVDDEDNQKIDDQNEFEEEEEEDKEDQSPDQNQKESPSGGQQAGFDEPDPNDPKYVVRCTLGGCFKYYHVKCVYQNKNVSCINSMKVQRFRCPLHYCEICQASGDSVLIVQCVACPTAYHVKCMPKGDPNAIRLTKKFVICKRHNMSVEDFPKFEEVKTTTNAQTKQQAQPQIEQLPIAPVALAAPLMQPPIILGPDGKPPPKKRGRKPRSHHIAMAEAAAQQALLLQQQQQRQKQQDSVDQDNEQPDTQMDNENDMPQFQNMGMIQQQQRAQQQQPPQRMNIPYLDDDDDDDDMNDFENMRLGIGIGMDDDEDDEFDFGRPQPSSKPQYMPQQQQQTPSSNTVQISMRPQQQQLMQPPHHMNQGGQQ